MSFFLTFLKQLVNTSVKTPFNAVLQGVLKFYAISLNSDRLFCLNELKPSFILGIHNRTELQDL